MNGVIDAVGLGKRYGRKWALTDCTLEIPSGHVVGLVGPNGAGKSTLLNLAVGLLSPTAGTINVLGEQPAGSPEELGRVGFVAQDTPTYSGLSVADHLGLGAHLNPTWDQTAAQSRIDQFGLDPNQNGRQALGRAAGPAGADPGGRQAARTTDPRRAGGKSRPPGPSRVPPDSDGDRGRSRGERGALVAPGGRSRAGVRLPHCARVVARADRWCRRRVARPTPSPHRRAPGSGNAPANQEVIEASHTERQTTILIRTADPILDPSWTVEPVGLEDLVLAYMGQAASAARRARPTLGLFE